MSNLNLLISYILTTLLFFLIDLVWLGLIAKKLYARYLGELLRDDVNWVAAIVFYLLFIVAIFVFVILPAHAADSMVKALVLGAFLGGICYATYDLTNLATLKGWPLPIVFIDITWGMFLTAVVSGGGFLIVKWLN